jgi:hypothetical protein
LALLVFLFAAAAARAGGEPFAEATPIDDAALDALRGGMDLGNGIQISFGFENIVFVNGELVVHTAFTLDPAMLAESGGLVQFIHDGMAADAVPEDATRLALSTVIQNALDTQVIQSLTILDVSVTSGDFIQSLRLEDLLSGQTLSFRP